MMERDELRSFIEAVLRQHGEANPEHKPHIEQALEALFGKPGPAQFIPPASAGG